MQTRWLVIVVLAVLAVGSFWLQGRLDDDPAEKTARLAQPDYIMTDVNSVKMGPDGQPENRLIAEYLEHFADQDMTELHAPLYQIYRPGREPLFASAERAWITEGNSVILLRDNVNFWEDADSGERVFHVITSEATVYPDRNYAETDKPAVIQTRDTRSSGVGMRAFMDESRIELLSQVFTVIKGKAERESQ